MMKRINIFEGYGKVLAGLVELDGGPYLLLVFNDQTYAVIGIKSGDDFGLEFDLISVHFDPLDHDSSDRQRLIRKGIITEEEFENSEANERRILARLKAKYEKE